MENKHCVEIQWQVDGIGELAEERNAYLAQCNVVLNCVRNFEWRIKLRMEDTQLKVSLGPATVPIVAHQMNIEWCACLVTAEGERWNCGPWIKEKFPLRDSYFNCSSFTLATSADLLDHDNGLLFEESFARLSVRIRPIGTDLFNSYTYFARSTVGVCREITWKERDFSSIGSNMDDEHRLYVLQKISTDKGENEMDMFLHVNDEEGSVAIRITPQFEEDWDSCGLIMEEVSILRSDGLKEECWKREARAGIPQDPTVTFIEKQKLIDNKTNLLPGDVLTLYVKFRDFNNYSMCRAGDVLEGVIPEFPELLPDPQTESTSLSHDMGALLESGSYSDFTLQAGSEAIPVHKNVLCARSPVFRAMLESPAWLEAARKSMDVPDFGPDAVRLLVRYLYSDRIPERMDAPDVAELYAAADKYALLGLRAHCSRILARDLRADTACVALRLAERHSDDDLKARVRAYMKANQRAVFLSPEWAAFMKEDPHLALELEHELHLKRFKST